MTLSSDHGSPAPPHRSAVAFILFTILLDVVALGIVIPVFPGLIRSFLGGDTPRAAEIYGLFGAIWALMQFLCSPGMGVLSDRIGRRPVILISNFGLGLDYILMAVAPNLVWLFIGRVIAGITTSNISTTSAYIADVMPPEKRASAFGLIGGAFGFGFILGPALGGVLGSIDPRLPFWVAAGLSLANAAYGFFVLPESLTKEHRRAFSWPRANPVGALKLLRSHPELSGLASVHFLYTIAHNALPSVFVLYTMYRYGWDERTVGLTLAGFGIAVVVVQGFLVKPIVAKWGERPALLVGLGCAVVGFLTYALSPSPVYFWIGMPVAAFWGLYNPASQALMTRRVATNEQGQLQGALSSILGITGMIGPALFTYTFAWFIRPANPVHFPGAPMVLAALFMAVAGVLAWRVTAPQPPAD